jgi:hypothetical protein
MAAHSAELCVRRERATALGTADHGRCRRHGSPAVRAEVGSPDERRPALAARGRRRTAHRHGRGEQRVQLLEAFVEGDELVAALDDQILAKLVAAEHLQHQPAEVAQALFANPQQRASLLPQLARMGESTSRRPRGARARNGPLVLAAKACQERWPRHAGQSNSEV